jgi:hypothetical protein
VLSGKPVVTSQFAKQEIDRFGPSSNSNNIVKPQAYSSSKLARTPVEDKMASLGYRRTRGNEWVKGNRVVHIVTSVEFGDRIRVTWKEKWIGDHVVVFDIQEPEDRPASCPFLFCSAPISSKKNELLWHALTARIDGLKHSPKNTSCPGWFLIMKIAWIYCKFAS